MSTDTFLEPGAEGPPEPSPEASEQGPSTSAGHDLALPPDVRDFDALLQHAIDEATDLVSADGGLVALRDELTGALRFVYGARLTETTSHAWAESLAATDGRGLINQAFTERRTRSTGDYLADDSFPHPRRAADLTSRLGIRSLVVAPMVANDESVGALAVYSERRDAFDPAQIALVRTLAGHAGALLANARLIAALDTSRVDLERRADTERTLRGIAARLAAMHEPGDILRFVVDEAARLTAADGARIDVMDEGEDAYRGAYGETVAGDIGPLDYRDDETDGAGLSAHAVELGRPMVTADYLADTSFRHSPVQDSFIERSGIHAAVSAPLVGQDGAVGALTVLSRRAAAFGERDVAIVAALADHLSASMANARLIDELRRSREELGRRVEAERSLSSIAARIAAIRSPREMYQSVADEAARLLRADGAIVDLLDASTGLLRWSYDTGASAEPGREWLRDLEVRIGEGTFGLAIERRHVVWTADYRADQSIVRSPILERFASELHVRSLVAAPLIADGEPIGAMGIYSSRPSAFDETDAALVGALADHASVAITNARLIEQLAGSREEVARRAETEHVLREMAQDLVTIRDPAELLQRVVDNVSRLVRADGTILALLDPDRNELRWSYDDGLRQLFDAEYVANLTLEVGVGVTGRAVAERRTIVANEDLVNGFPRSPESDHFFEVSGFRSMIGAPIVGEHGPLGALEVYSTREHAFDEVAAALIQAFAGQAAVAITNARLIEELGRSREELGRRAAAERGLREIAGRLATIRDPADLLSHAVDAARRLLRADGSLLDLVDENGLIRAAYDSGVEGEEAVELLRALDLPVGKGMFGVAIAEKRPLATNDYLNDASFPHSPGSDELARLLRFRSMVVAPLMTEVGAVGVLGVYSSREDAFDEADIALLGAFADQAAIAVTNARLIDDLARSREEVARRAENERTLREITSRITSMRDQREVLQIVVDESKRLLACDDAHLTLLSEDRTYLQPMVVAGGTDEEAEAWLKTQQFPVGAGMNGLAAALNEPVRTADYLADPRIPHEPDDIAVAERMGLRGMAVAPLRSGAGEPIGTLAISCRDPRLMSDADLQLLQDLADQAAIAVTNLRLYERLAESEKRYRHLVQNSPDLVWSIDADVKFSFLSDTCERLTGWRPDELIGKHFGAIVHPSSAEAATRDWAEGLSGPEHELRGRLFLLHRDGHEIPAEFNALARFEDGRFAGANGSVRDMTDRDRLERELRDSEARYREIVATTPDLIWETDGDGTFTFMSATLRSMLDVEPDQAIGQRFDAILHPDTREDAYRGWAEVVANPGRVMSARFSLRHRDGHAVPIENYSIGRTEGDRFVGAHGSARDVSERERLERELRESEARYRYLVKASPDVVWAVDDRGWITFMSDRIEPLTGFLPDEVIGQGFSVLMVPEDIPTAVRTWEAVKRDPFGVYPLTIRVPRKDGEPIPVEIWVTGQVHDGKFSGAHGSIRDLRERERLERQVRESEARYRYLVENSPDMVWSADADGRFTYISDTSEPLIGWKPEELLGRHWSTLVHPDFVEFTDAQYQPSITALTPQELRYRFDAIHRNGNRIPMEMHARTIIDDGRYVGAHGAVRDLRDRERLERDLLYQAAELASSEERAHLARELHDSVTQALFSMTLLTRSIELLMDRDPAAAAEKLSSLRELQKDALAETRALLFELRPSSLAEEGLIRALRTHTAAVQGRIGLPVLIEADEIGRLPIAIEDALYRIAQEALHNVVKHANARRVRIEIRQEASVVKLTVEDDGVGFDPIVVPGGHLGLAGMRARAEKIGGRLTVRSSAGHGTQIEIVVDASQTASAAAQPAQAASDRATEGAAEGATAPAVEPAPAGPAGDPSAE